MDITPQFNQVLAGHDSRPVRPYVLRVEALDEFVKEAYRIRSHISNLRTELKSIRQSYLSTAQPPRRKLDVRIGTPTSTSKDIKYLNDAERSEIDAQAKQSLRELNHAINTLRDAEQIRQTTETQVALQKRAKQGLGALGRWASGGALTAKSPKEELAEAKANAVKAHREGIIWSLSNQLEECSSFQSKMMEIRLTREFEKTKSMLHKVGGAVSDTSHVNQMNGHHEVRKESDNYRGKATYAAHEESAAIENQLDPEQLQLFQQENQDMLKQYEDQLDKVRDTEKSLLEIAELQSTLANNLSVQAAHIDQLVEDSFNTTENVGGGNKELKRATERKSTARMVFWSTCVFCTTLVLWDLFI